METEVTVESVQNRAKFDFLKRALIIILILAVLAGLFFVFAALKSESRFALRNAKNALFAIETVGIQHRGYGSVIFTRRSMDGFAEGVLEEVKTLSGCQGELRIMDYDAETNEVIRMTYREEHFLVSYDRNQDKNWTLELIIKLETL